MQEKLHAGEVRQWDEQIKAKTDMHAQLMQANSQHLMTVVQLTQDQCLSQHVMTNAQVSMQAQ